MARLQKLDSLPGIQAAKGMHANSSREAKETWHAMSGALDMALLTENDAKTRDMARQEAQNTRCRPRERGDMARQSNSGNGSATDHGAECSADMAGRTASGLPGAQGKAAGAEFDARQRSTLTWQATWSFVEQRRVRADRGRGLSRLDMAGQQGRTAHDVDFCRCRCAFHASTSDRRRRISPLEE
jgi:hypothetical protein